MNYTVRLDVSTNPLMQVPNVEYCDVDTEEGYVPFTHKNGEETIIMLHSVLAVTPQETAAKEW